MDVIMIIFEDQKWPTEPKRNIFSVYVELVSQAQCSRLLLLNIAIKSAHCIVISRVILDVPWKHRNVFGKLPRNICGEKTDKVVDKSQVLTFMLSPFPIGRSFIQNASKKCEIINRRICCHDSKFIIKFPLCCILDTWSKIQNKARKQNDVEKHVNWE